MKGEQFCADMRKREIHDLDNEQAGCFINLVIVSRYDRPFPKLPSALAIGFTACTYCIGGDTIPLANGTREPVHGHSTR